MGGETWAEDVLESVYQTVAHLRGTLQRIFQIEAGSLYTTPGLARTPERLLLLGDAHSQIATLVKLHTRDVMLRTPELQR